MKVLGIIPARGGSKGVPRKNIRLLSGKPLLYYTAEAARQSKRLSRVVLSTDDPEIADVGRRLGIDVPFMRPQELAADDSTTLSVVQHLIGRLKETGEAYDAICLLQPTSPFRTDGLIDLCIDRLVNQEADSVVTVLPVPHQYNPYWAFLPSTDGFLELAINNSDIIPQRQQLPPAFIRDGSVYVISKEVLSNAQSLLGDRIGYIVSDHPGASINIDTLQDWNRAENFLASLTLIDRVE